MGFCVRTCGYHRKKPRSLCRQVWLVKEVSEATVTAYKMPDAPHMATYSAQFISTTSKSIPFTGNFETKLALTADSGVELEYEQTETVITEDRHV